MYQNDDGIPKDYEGLLAAYNDLKKDVKYTQYVGNRFIGKMRYDFNTLLNSITGYLYSSLENADAASRPAIEGALRTSQVLLNKHADLADYLSLVLGGYPPSVTTSSIELLVRQINQEFDEALAVKNLSFISKIDENLPDALEFDYYAVKKALSELVENAIQNTPEGAIRLNATRLSEEDDIVAIRFEVIDQGNGIDEAKIQAMIHSEPAPEESRRTDVSGFGLQVAKDFLVHAGATQLGASNGLNGGATFSFVINARAVQSSTPAPEEKAAAPADSGAKSKSLAGIKVLLTDDSVIMQQIVKQMLEGEGAEVLVAVNGEEGVQQFKQTKPDIVLMDVEMPVMNGLDASRAINEIKSELQLQTPILGMTAHTGQEEYDKCIESGMNSVVIKPFKLDGLLSAFYQVLYNKEFVAVEDAEAPIEASIYHFDKIKGIDAVEGVKRLSGNEKLYFELLQNFRDGYADCIPTIETLLKEGNDSEVKNLLHLIKGVSGNLSFNEIYDYANKLRDAVEQDNIVDIGEYLKLFGTALEEFKQSFNAAEVEILYSMSEVMDMDLMLVKSRLDELMDYLDTNVDLGNAMDACDDVYDYMKETEYKKDFGKVRDAIHSFDLEYARKLLESFMEKFTTAG